DGKTSLYVAGEPMLKGWIYYHSKELAMIFGITFGVMVLLLWAHFRSISGVVVPMLGTGLSAVWGLGFVGWMGFNLDPLILVVPILISARTASHCVQFMERYYDEIRLGRDKDTAVRVSMGELIVPGSIAIFTDAAGLLVLAVSSMPIIAKLGYFCAVWSASNMITVAVFVPLILSLLPMPTIDRNEEHKHLPSRMMDGLGHFLVGKRATQLIFGATALIGVWSLYYGWAPPLGESKPGSPILFADSEYNIAAAHIADRFAGANQFSIYFEGDGAHRMKDPEVVAMMEEFGRYMADTFNYGGTREIPHLVRSINRLYHYDDPRWSLIPKEQKDIGNTLFMYEAGAAMPGVILEYMDLEGRTANFVVFYKDATGKTVHTALDAAKAFLKKHDIKGVTPRLAGGIIGTTAAANEETKASDLKMTGLIITLVMIAVMVTYRSFIAGLLVLVVLGLAVMMNRAFMTIRDIGLNVNTMPVTAVGVGLGVDYALYMLDRIKEEVKHRSLDDAIIVAMRTTGAAVLFTAVMVIAGIIYWIPGSSLRFNSEMSLLLCMLMISNMIGAVTVIPLLVRVLKPSFVMKVHEDDTVTAADAAQAENVWRRGAKAAG
ncbi:MAG: RND family transporter, partial [Gammaproteobacteria bacterium]